MHGRPGMWGGRPNPLLRGRSHVTESKVPVSPFKREDNAERRNPPLVKVAAICPFATAEPAIVKQAGSQERLGIGGPRCGAPKEIIHEARFEWVQRVRRGATPPGRTRRTRQENSGPALTVFKPAAPAMGASTMSVIFTVRTAAPENALAHSAPGKRPGWRAVALTAMWWRWLGLGCLK